MLTRRGLLVLTAGLVLAVTGRVLGIVELFAVATAMVGLVVASVIYAKLCPINITATRQLRPPRVHAGGSSRVELTVANGGRRRTPVVTLRDPFDGGRRWARFPLAPLPARDAARAAYRLPTDDRGIYSLGPLEVVLTDPFGLASSSREAAGSTALTVFPRVDPIAPLPKSTGPDPMGTAAHPRALTLSGEEFYAIREYQTGDDLRRVHWPSTARLDEIMIRQDELPWQGRATVLIDMRRQLHTHDSFEVTMSAAASIANAASQAGSLVRVVTSSGFDSDFGVGHAHLEAIYEHLAAADPHTSHPELAAAVTRLRQHSQAGALAVLTTNLAPPSDLLLAQRLRGRYGVVIMTLVEATPGVNGAAAKRLSQATSAGPVVRVGANGSFASEWNAAMLPANGRRAAARRLS